MSGNNNRTLKLIRNALGSCFTRSCRLAKRAIGMPNSNNENTPPERRSLFRERSGAPKRRQSITEANLENFQRNPELYNERSRNYATSVFAERNRVRREAQERENRERRRREQWEEAERFLEETLRRNREERARQAAETERLRREAEAERNRQAAEAAERARRAAEYEKIRRIAEERMRREAEERARAEAEEKARAEAEERARGEGESNEEKCRRILASHNIKSRKDFLKWAKTHHPDKVAFAPGTPGYLRAEELFKSVRECAEFIFKNGGGRTKKVKKNGKRRI